VECKGKVAVKCEMSVNIILILHYNKPDIHINTKPAIRINNKPGIHIHNKPAIHIFMQI
jgi:hypothetical protein